MVVTLSNIHKTYGEQQVLKGVTFFVGPHDRLALIGRNGSGKTTLLKIITGLETPDEGSVTRTGKTSIAFRPQQDSLCLTATVIEEMKQGWPTLTDIETELSELDVLLSQSAEDRHIKRHSELWNAYEAAGGLTWHSESERILAGLGLEGRDNSLVSELSGGEKTKLSLAKLLAGNYDLLVLDEPSNHLDLDTTIWLENYLSEYPKALLIVTHDRSLLRRIATRIVDLEAGKVETYGCGYDDFVEEREIRRDNRQRTYDRQIAFIRKEEEYIRRNIEGQNTKQAQGRRKRLARFEVIDRPVVLRDFKFPLRTYSRSGEIVLRIANVSLGFESRKLFSNFNFEVIRRDRIAIVGANGTGKTSLLRLIAGRCTPQSGTIKLGVGVDMMFFDQEHAELELNESPYDMTFRVINGATEQSVRNTLGAFGFSGLAVDKHISALSGGERTRLSLMKVVVSGANVLMLDEPTNHLDIDAIDSLKNSLQDYDGTLLLVSHDRDFLMSVCDKFLILDNKPKFISGISAFVDYLESRGGKRATATRAQKNVDTALEHKERKRLANELKRLEEQLAKLEENVARAERDKKACDEELVKYSHDYVKCLELSGKRANIEWSIEDFFNEMLVIEEQIIAKRDELGFDDEQ